MSSILSFFADAENVKWLLKQGFSAVLLTVVLYWVAAYYVGPMQAKHMELVDKCVDTQVDLANSYREQTNLLRDALRR